VQQSECYSIKNRSFFLPIISIFFNPSPPTPGLGFKYWGTLCPNICHLSMLFNLLQKGPGLLKFAWVAGYSLFLPPKLPAVHKGSLKGKAGNTG